jgi:hypothetical protein
MTILSPRTSTNPVMIIGWVVAAVVILVLIGGLVWWLLERRRRRTLRITSLLGSEDPPLSPFLGSSARPVSTAATKQVTLIILLPTLRCDKSGHLQSPQDRMRDPQQPAPSHAAAYPIPPMESKSSRLLSQERTIHAPGNSHNSSTVPPDPPGIENLSDLPSIPAAHQGSRVEKNRRFRISRSAQQGPATCTTPPGHSYTNSTANRVQPQTPNEPVEGDAISRQLSRVTLPPYSPGEFLRDEAVPPLPGR